jgi:hypothetical protein
MAWNNKNAFAAALGRLLGLEEIAQGVLNEGQDALKVQSVDADGDAVVPMSEATGAALLAAIGSGADAAGANTVIGQLKQIAINTAP